jgi:flagellar biosynthesis anti-sigma factor FlgM
MRIDLNSASMPELERSRGSSNASPGSSVSVENTTQTDDVANLSTGHEAVSTLSAQLKAVPDVRQELVESLRQAIHSGTFRVSPDGIADKMLSDRAG